MKAFCLDKIETFESLYLAERPVPEPGADEIRIRVKAAGLNPVDYKMASRGHENWTYPFILGVDAAGTVDKVGTAVSDLKPGDPVVYHGDLSRPGSFAEYAVTKAHVVTRIPDGLSFTDAAALPCAGYTAYQAVHRKLKVERGKSILIHGGAGGVGGFALQLCRLAGLKVFTTCSMRNFDYVKSLGADHAIDYNVEDLIATVKSAAGARGFDYIVDAVGPETATASLEMLAFGGELVCCNGFPDFSRITRFKTALSIHEVALGAAHLTGDRAAQIDLSRIGEIMTSLAAQGKLNCLVAEIIPFEEIPAGLRKLAERHNKGKIVASIGA